jgi:uncharacterized protein
MDITPLVGSGQQIIQSYSGGRFRISGRNFDSAVIVFPDRTLEWVVTVPPQFDDFARLIDAAAELDVVLFGCGGIFAPLDPVLRRALKATGLSVDVMDTGAACRTYNVLMAEGRRVAAALLPV